MPVPFDLIAAMLYLGFYIARPAPAPLRSAWTPALAAAFGLGLALAATVANRVGLALVARSSPRGTAGKRAALGVETTIRLALVLAYIGGLNASAFPWGVAAWLGFGGDSPFLIQLLALIPYAAYFVCAWLPLYGLHRETVPGRWTRRSFLLHKARYNLVMLLAWIPFAVFSEWLSRAMFALPLLLAAAAWIFPCILAKAWGCRPLPPGEALDLARELEAKVGASFSQAYLWEPGGGRTQNAAAVGVFKPFRYLFVTPALVSGMNRDELAAVILHELGHVKNRHLLFYLFTTVAGLNAAVLATEFLPFSGDAERYAAMVFLVLFHFRFVFGWFSRLMERQADLFALKMTGSASGLANALEKLGLSAGNIRNERSWHHSGIAERVRFLREAEREPSLAAAHDARASRVMGLGYILSVAIMAVTGAAAHVDPSPPAAVAGVPARHWRRVRRLLPGNAVGPLELAYVLASAPALRGEAIFMAREAVRHAQGKEEREAARKLLSELDVPSGHPLEAERSGAAGERE